MRRQRNRASNSKGANQCQRNGIHTQLFGKTDYGRNQNRSSYRLARKYKMTIHGNEDKHNSNNRRIHLVKMNRCNELVDQPAGATGFIQRITDRIGTGREEHKVPFDFCFFPGDNAYFRQQAKEHRQYSGLFRTDGEPEPAFLVIPGRPQKQGEEEYNGRFLFFNAQRTHLFQLAL